MVQGHEQTRNKKLLGAPGIANWSDMTLLGALPGPVGPGLGAPRVARRGRLDPQRPVRTVRASGWAAHRPLGISRHPLEGPGMDHNGSPSSKMVVDRNEAWPQPVAAALARRGGAPLRGADVRHRILFIFSMYTFCVFLFLSLDKSHFFLFFVFVVVVAFVAFVPAVQEFAPGWEGRWRLEEDGQLRPVSRLDAGRDRDVHVKGSMVAMALR